MKASKFFYKLPELCFCESTFFEHLVSCHCLVLSGLLKIHFSDEFVKPWFGPKCGKQRINIHPDELGLSLVEGILQHIQSLVVFVQCGVKSLGTVGDGLILTDMKVNLFLYLLCFGSFTCKRIGNGKHHLPLIDEVRSQRRGTQDLNGLLWIVLGEVLLGQNLDGRFQGSRLVHVRLKDCNGLVIIPGILLEHGLSDDCQRRVRIGGLSVGHLRASFGEPPLRCEEEKTVGGMSLEVIWVKLDGAFVVIFRALPVEVEKSAGESTG